MCNNPWYSLATFAIRHCLTVHAILGHTKLSYGPKSTLERGRQERLKILVEYERFVDKIHNIAIAVLTCTVRCSTFEGTIDVFSYEIWSGILILAKSIRGRYAAHPLVTSWILLHPRQLFIYMHENLTPAGKTTKHEERQTQCLLLWSSENPPRTTLLMPDYPRWAG